MPRVWYWSCLVPSLSYSCFSLHWYSHIYPSNVVLGSTNSLAVLSISVTPSLPVYANLFCPSRGPLLYPITWWISMPANCSPSTSSSFDLLKKNRLLKASNQVLLVSRYPLSRCLNWTGTRKGSRLPKPTLFWTALFFDCCSTDIQVAAHISTLNSPFHKEHRAGNHQESMTSGLLRFNIFFNLQCGSFSRLLYRNRMPKRNCFCT